MVRPKPAAADAAAAGAVPAAGPGAPAAAASPSTPSAATAASSKPATAAASVNPAASTAATKPSLAVSPSGSPASSQPPAPLSPPILLLTLCGLPAAGKSSLCRALSMHAADALEQQGLVPSCVTHYISFDAVYERLLRRSQKGAASAASAPSAFSPALWKQSRLVALQWAESIIVAARSYAASSTSPSAAAPHLLLLDDNFYLRSMRRRVFQMARAHSTGLMQLHVVCDVEEAVRRNAARNQTEQQEQEQQPQVSHEDEQLLIRIINALPSSASADTSPAAAASSSASSSTNSASEDSTELDAASLLSVSESSQVSEATIRKMAAAFQPPPITASSASSSSSSVAAAAASLAAGAGWERDSVRFESGDLRSLMETLTRMAAAFRAPWTPVEDAAEEAERLAAARAQSASSFLHQLDLATRKIVGQRIAEMTADGADAAAVQLVAKRWNAQRKQLLKQAGTDPVLAQSTPDFAGALASMVAQFVAQLTI